MPIWTPTAIDAHEGMILVSGEIVVDFVITGNSGSAVV